MRIVYQYSIVKNSQTPFFTSISHAQFIFVY